jgi:hypothetical protein
MEMVTPMRRPAGNSDSCLGKLFKEDPGGHLEKGNARIHQRVEASLRPPALCCPQTLLVSENTLLLSIPLNRGNGAAVHYSPLQEQALPQVDIKKIL